MIPTELKFRCAFNEPTSVKQLHRYLKGEDMEYHSGSYGLWSDENGEALVFCFDPKLEGDQSLAEIDRVNSSDVQVSGMDFWLSVAHHHRGVWPVVRDFLEQGRSELNFVYLLDDKSADIEEIESAYESIATGIEQAAGPLGSTATKLLTVPSSQLGIKH